MKNVKELFEARYKVKKNKNLVHSIVSKIAVDEICNFVLATGSKIICAEAIEEVESITKNADALTITLANINENRYGAIKKSLLTAKENNIPVSFDSVGATVSSYRKNIVEELFKIKIPEVVKGNFTEINSLLTGNTQVGIDEDKNLKLRLKDKKIVVSTLSKELDTTVVATGEVDIIADSKTIVTINNGASFMSEIVGTGCMLNGIIGSYLTELNPFDAAFFSVLSFDVAGEMSKGNSPSKRFLEMKDIFYNLTLNNILEYEKVEYEKI